MKIRKIDWNGNFLTGGVRIMINQSNIERFSGFADTYDQFRPSAPKMVPEIVGGYLGRRPRRVVDIGCGTGLSSMIWKGLADEVVGVEPNDDMRAVAERKAEGFPDFHFAKGLSNATGLEGESVDVVTISQAFHWMDSDSTLAEVDRVLAPGGVLAVFDCDWPPVVDSEVEMEYLRLHALCEEVSMQVNNQVSRKEKGNHLEAIQSSGLFRYVREVVFHHTEAVGADRMVGILLSQGGIQAALRAEPLIRTEIDGFANLVRKRMGEAERETVFSYRMRLGVKAYETV